MLILGRQTTLLTSVEDVIGNLPRSMFESYSIEEKKQQESTYRTWAPAQKQWRVRPLTSEGCICQAGGTRMNVCPIPTVACTDLILMLSLCRAASSTCMPKRRPQRRSCFTLSHSLLAVLARGLKTKERFNQLSVSFMWKMCSLLCEVFGVYNNNL